MTLDEYQQAALRTMNWDTDPERNLTVLALGLAGEAGEVADRIKKYIGHGHPFERVLAANEVGDVLWYCVVMLDLLGYTASEGAQMNIDKLMQRYPEGFSSERSINRIENQDGQEE